MTRAVSLALALLALPLFGAPPYTERYRPQFHFSPRQGWMGDPDGLVRHRGQYHLFWWGHAVSPDLVHWRELPWPMLGGDDSFMYYSGSVVADLRNTAGWGTPEQPALVAIYTAHERASGRENQRLSISTNGTTFHYYDGNPVLSLNSRSFRDPDVFWHEPSASWIMAVALPDERKIHFYASGDLKSWRYLSAFGPLAARAPLWETPNLFPLPVDGAGGTLKWVLTCSLGPNAMQYFVGDFDGRAFKPDPEDLAYLTKGQGLEGDVWQDFEGPTIGSWTVSGEAFGDGPIRGGPRVTGYLGRGLVSSLARGEGATGTLRSPAFPVTRNCINFLVAGGDRPQDTCVNLVVSGRVVRSATGGRRESLVWAGWNVAAWKGQEARLELVDRSEAAWGYLAVDHIVFSDTLWNTQREHAHGVDGGADFYAARVYRDYDQAMTSTVWQGWMGNWDYAHAVPTSWGQGAQSIPRELALVSSPRGYALVQQPPPALRSLRGAPVTLAERRVRGALAWPEFRPRRNVYELEAEFALQGGDQEVGLNLCVGGADRVVLAYDATTANVTLDRRTSGAVSFSDRFPQVSAAPLPGAGDRLKLHVFVDQSSLEVFVNDGQVVLTSQIFPHPGSTGLEVFSSRGESVLLGLTAWELASIWP